MKKIINIGIVAHVDAGKTTITENLLYYSGAIKSVGRVDLGNTQTDSMELERKRGITIKSSTISFNWNNVKVNIVDTPGHVDFISEVERSLSVLDGAILVISGVEGIQSQTRILFETLKELNIPTIIFVNKLDRIGANFNKVFEDIKKNMSNKVVRLQEVYDVGSKAVYIKKLFDTCMINDDAIDVLSDLDEAFLERYIGGIEPDKEEIQEKLSLYASEGSLYPVFCGAAAIGLGVEDLLDGICSYFPFAGDDCESDLSGVVFKIERTSKNEKKVYVRLFGGKISVRDKIQVPNKEIAEKVKKINRLENGGVVEAQRIEAGDIGILYGLTSFQVGDVIGISNDKITLLDGKIEYNVNTTPWNTPFLPDISFDDYENPLPDIYKNIYDIPLENGMNLGEKATDFTARIASNKMTISGANLQNAMRDFEYARENEHAYILNSRSEIKNEGLSKLMDKVGIPKNSRGVIYDNNSKQSKQLWNSPEIQEFITNNYLKLLNNKQDNAVEIEFKFNLINMDNFLGIQHCQLYNPHITSDGYFNGIVVDYYDFRYRTPAGIGDFPNNINNWGYSMQEKGFLENHFNIYVIHEKL